MEIRLPIGIRKEGAVRDMYKLLLKGIEPRRWTYRSQTKRPKTGRRIRIIRPPIIVTSRYIKKRFGINA